MRKDEVEFDLEKEIPYQHGGDNKTGQKMILRAPSSKQQDQRIKLKQGLRQAFLNLQLKMKAAGKEAIEGADTTDDGEPVDASTYVNVLYMSDLDMAEYLKTFRSLLTSGAGRIEGEEVVTDNILSKVHPDDLDDMLGMYLENFIPAS